MGLPEPLMLAKGTLTRSHRTQGQGRGRGAASMGTRGSVSSELRGLT
jgi:hypothetical protein